MDWFELGKKVFFFSLAVLVGLILGHAMLEAHSSEPPRLKLNSEALQSVVPPDPVLNIKRIKIPTFRKEKPRHLVPITAKETRAALRRVVKSAAPFALLNSNGLYVLDSEGYVLAPIDSMAVFDLPTISGEAIQLDLNAMQLVGSGIADALDFLRWLQRHDAILASQVSEIVITPKVGLVAFINGSRTLPVFLGASQMERKAAYLSAYYDQLGQSGLTELARYLDCRVEGQIILKKMTL